MSEQSKFVIVPRIVWQGLQPREIKVYCALASYADWDTGVCWPSRARLADDLGVSVSTVDRALSRLVKAGVIEIDKRKTDRGDHDSNLYRLPFAINAPVGGRKTAGTSPQNWGGGGRKTAGETRTIERQGLTTPKNNPDNCPHLPMDEDGYCTACGNTVRSA